MQICRLTVPGLSMRRDFEAARHRLLEDFPHVHEVLATTAPSTLLVLYSGADEVDRWLDSLLETVTIPGANERSRISGWLERGRGGADSAA